MKAVWALVAAMAMSGAANAEIVVQRWPAAGPLPNGVELFASSIVSPSTLQELGQTLTADVSGRLIGFDVLLSRDPLSKGADPLFNLKLYSSPNGDLLASRSFAAPSNLTTALNWTTVDVSSANLQLTSGSNLFYTLQSDAMPFNTNVLWWGAFGNGGGLYSGGQALTKYIGSCPVCGTWQPYNIAPATSADFAFRMNIDTAVAAVPEPATWAMLIAGFGAIGTVLRRRRKNEFCARLA